ncbi:hypothetical protein [Thiomicrorhabdus sp.]|uniref:hypothetical protein n=1 Tax=Thiomicrorhabdus sp. TaxID=2039724 RepID=UPI0029C8DFEB|nr:hypothetical protein [Thiomicrorhabdus sp.]
MTGELRTLDMGDQVFSGDILQTQSGSLVLGLVNGENVPVGPFSELNLDSFLSSKEGAVGASKAALDNLTPQGALSVEDINDLDTPAAGEEDVIGSGSATGLVVDRLAYDGAVDSGYGLPTGVGGIGNEMLVGRGSLAQKASSLLDDLGGDNGTDQTLLGPDGVVDEIVDGVTDVVDDLLGTDLGAIDKPLDNVTTDVEDLLTGEADLGETVESLLGDEGSVDQVVDGVTDVVDDLLGTDLGAIDKPLDNVTTDVEDLLTGEADLGETVESLLGDEGSVDQVVDGVTDVVDDLLGTDLGAIDKPLDNVTTDVEDLLTGEADLGETVESLLGDEGSVDQVVDGVTDVVDDLLGTDLGAIDKPLDNVTTDVEDLLTGEADLGETVESLLGDEGSVDQVVDGVTDVVDDLLGTDLGAIDKPLDNVTTDVEDLLTGEADLGETVESLLGDEGSVDQVVDGVTDVVDDLLGTDLGAIDKPLDNVTTDVEDLLTGEADLGETVESLLGDEGSVDQVVDGVTDLVDNLLGTNLSALDEPLDSVTTAVSDLLEGLTGVLGSSSGSLLGEQGSADQVVDGVTDVVDDALGTNLGAIDQPEDQVTTDVQNLLNGENSLVESIDNFVGDSGSVDQLVAGVSDVLEDAAGIDLSGLDQTVDEVTSSVGQLLTGDVAGVLSSGSSDSLVQPQNLISTVSATIESILNTSSLAEITDIGGIVDQVSSELSDALGSDPTDIAELLDNGELIDTVQSTLDGILSQNGFEDSVDGPELLSQIGEELTSVLGVDSLSGGLGSDLLETGNLADAVIGGLEGLLGDTSLADSGELNGVVEQVVGQLGETLNGDISELTDLDGLVSSVTDTLESVLPETSLADASEITGVLDQVGGVLDGVLNTAGSEGEANPLDAGDLIGDLVSTVDETLDGLLGSALGGDQEGDQEVAEAETSITSGGSSTSADVGGGLLSILLNTHSNNDPSQS